MGNEKGPNDPVFVKANNFFFQAVGDMIEISEKMEDEEEGMEGVEDKEWQEEE